MVLSSFVLLFAVTQMASSPPSRTLAEPFRHSAAEACALVGQAEGVTDAALQERIYRPLAAQVVAQLKQLPPSTTAASRTFEASSYTARAKPDASVNWQPSEEDLQLLANVAGGVADTIIERYRESFRQSGEAVPTLVTFRSPGEEQGDRLSRITQDVRLYCGKSQARDVGQLFPGLDGARQPQP
jgi:hypothetical protein